MSRPMRARGLKRKRPWRHRHADLVAPHAGAWIETRVGYVRRCHASVAPHAGAWIETYLQNFEKCPYYVAPHAGAWIETRQSI